MRIVFHESKLSPYRDEQLGVRFVSSPFVHVGRSVEYFGGEYLPIPRLDDLVDSTNVPSPISLTS